MNLADRLAKLPLFKGLPASQIQEIAKVSLLKKYAKGENIFSEGDENYGFYVIISGRAKVFKLSSEGKEQIFHFFAAGDTLGEVSVFTDQGFPASAAADEETTAIFIPRASFIELIRRDPTLALNMLGILSLRLRKFATLVEDLSLKEVPGRLAAHLLYLSEKTYSPDDLRLDISKTQLAALLGTIPETLSRIMTKMGKAGLINVEGSLIRILNEKTLTKVARGEVKL
ncbi:MAG: Crp/Fnr family transcriptional regulator [Smithellaceae bacterium]|nr:Crp/Fnr family transcriptional regulator [Smithellaceae bacterium]